MTPAAFIVCFLLAAVVLAGWTIVRFESWGPKTLTGALLASLVAIAGLAVLPAAVDGVTTLGLRGSAYIVVFGIGLPAFTYFFLSAGWVMRSFRSMLEGFLR